MATGATRAARTTARASTSRTIFCRISLWRGRLRVGAESRVLFGSGRIHDCEAARGPQGRVRDGTGDAEVGPCSHERSGRVWLPLLMKQLLVLWERRGLRRSKLGGVETIQDGSAVEWGTDEVVGSVVVRMARGRAAVGLQVGAVTVGQS